MKKEMNKQICLLSFFLLAAVSCSSEAELADGAAPCRTVLVYLAGDNSLSDEVGAKTDALVAGWRNRRDNLLIYRDSRDAGGTPSLLKVEGDAEHPYAKVVKEYPESNSASPEIFSEVLRDVTTGYPAPSYGLLVFSHGTGWLPEGSYTNPRSGALSLRSIMEDNGREMAIAGFADAIPDGQFDFIVLEACLMASVEVAWELRGKADYLLASSAEILSPGFTPVYPAVLEALFRQPEADLQAVADSYYGHCNSLEAPYRSATVSVVRLDRMDELAEAMRGVYACIADIPEEWAGEVQCFDRSEDRLFFDLGCLLERIKEEGGPEARRAATVAGNVLTGTVAGKAATPFFVDIPVFAHSGLTTYIEQGGYPWLNTAWRRTSWGRGVTFGLIQK